MESGDGRLIHRVRTLVGGVLLLAVLSHCMPPGGVLLLPLLLTLFVRCQESDPKWSLALSLTLWAGASAVLLSTLNGPPFAFAIDYDILAFENTRCASAWTWQMRWAAWAVVIGGHLLTWKRFSPAWGRTGFLLCLAISLVARLWTFSPEMLTAFSRVLPDGYVHDHFLYQEQWRQMKLGHDYYEAAREGFLHDKRGFGTTVRPPMMFWMWSLLPMPPITLYIAFTAVAVISLGAIYLLARELTTPERALLAPALLAPQYAYAGASALYLFIEYWVAPLAMVSIIMLMRGSPRRSLWLALLCSLMREFMVFLLLGVSLAVLVRERRRAVVPLVLCGSIWTIYYSVHLEWSRWVLPPNALGASSLWQAFHQGGWDHLYACLKIGSHLLDHTPWIVALIVIAGAMGLGLLRKELPRPLWWGWIVTVMPYWGIFLVLGHAPVVVGSQRVYGAEPWGMLLLFWWFALATRGLGEAASPKEARATAHVCALDGAE